MPRAIGRGLRWPSGVAASQMDRWEPPPASPSRGSTATGSACGAGSTTRGRIATLPPRSHRGSECPDRKGPSAVPSNCGFEAGNGGGPCPTRTPPPLIRPGAARHASTVRPRRRVHRLRSRPAAVTGAFRRNRSVSRSTIPAICSLMHFRRRPARCPLDTVTPPPPQKASRRAITPARGKHPGLRMAHRHRVIHIRKTLSTHDLPDRTHDAADPGPPLELSPAWGFFNQVATTSGAAEVKCPAKGTLMGASPAPPLPGLPAPLVARERATAGEAFRRDGDSIGSLR
jgi:hypothetical protein